MKPLTINVQITKCPKQYEAVRLGGDWTVDEGESAESVIKQATAELNRIYAEMYAPKPAAAEAKAEPAPAAEKPAKKEPLKFEDARVQQAVKRMENNPEKKKEIYNKMLEYFEPDAEALKVLQLAAAVI
jgi:hypothetical protein